mmetsp:Transcript_4683/g.9448  ORF Transcript_4683/g.9448 Transcript_4683/m.9448 type:complete len:149 (+) Transcript_4683:1621-2067(+)
MESARSSLLENYKVTRENHLLRSSFLCTSPSLAGFCWTPRGQNLHRGYSLLILLPPSEAHKGSGRHLHMSASMIDASHLRPTLTNSEINSQIQSSCKPPPGSQEQGNFFSPFFETVAPRLTGHEIIRVANPLCIGWSKCLMKCTCRDE